MKVFHYRIDHSNMFHCFNYRPFGRNMFAFLNVNRDKRGRHVHVDTGIINCGNGGVRRFELSRHEYKNRNARKTCFSKVGDFYRWREARKNFESVAKTDGRSGFRKQDIFFFLGLISLCQVLSCLIKFCHPVFGVCDTP